MALNLNPSTSFDFLQIPIRPRNFTKFHFPPNRFSASSLASHQRVPILRRTNSYQPTYVSGTETEEEEEEEEGGEESSSTMVAAPSIKRQRRRYRKQYPGEKEGITEEMRFVAMKLRNKKGKNVRSDEEDNEDDADEANDGDKWQPTMDGFLKYLVDSELVFRTVERIVDASTDVSYVYFRKTGLERSDGLRKDLQWLVDQGHTIPQPSNPGIAYAQYLEELSEKSPPLFLCHLYNIYFSHIAGGQVIAKKVSERLMEKKEMEFFMWEGDEQVLLKGVREKLNALGEHWSRDEKNKCLREATKAFRFMGQIVRLIILV